jgi:hypothetical protein
VRAAQGDVCKPEVAAFERVIAHTGCVPAQTVMFEVRTLAACMQSAVLAAAQLTRAAATPQDSFKNLVTAKALGMRTVLVGGATLAEEGPEHALVGATLDAHVAVCGLEAVRAAMPQLWPASSS